MTELRTSKELAETRERMEKEIRALRREEVFAKAREHRAERRTKMTREEIFADVVNDDAFARLFNSPDGVTVLEIFSETRPIVAEEIKERLNRVAAKNATNTDGKETPGG